MASESTTRGRSKPKRTSPDSKASRGKQAQPKASAGASKGAVKAAAAAARSPDRKSHPPTKVAPAKAKAAALGSKAAPAKAKAPDPENGPKRLVPIEALPSRHERVLAESLGHQIDDVCSAWAAIIAERMAADQVFAETYELYQNRPRDLRGLFLWDALHAAEAHVNLLNTVIARHLSGNRADPFAILGELRHEQRRSAAVYGVNAFLAVLNQMSPNKPKWLSTTDLDPRMAVLAMAHQTLEYALEAARVEAPADLTEEILRAAQDESVWSGARDAGDRTLAACAAAASFFRALGIQDLASVNEVASLYETRVRSRAS
jgi:hypothetical protein